ncbi:MAG: DUF4149 domain-containing protein [Betaproteobacteria bacterium]|nr:DUF4149 domain-containing protein [Pseudomonadota bacterium]NBO13384.1 DUF4149 domain-containing protein [Betaproteobacteria bacterium]NBP11621.1 DUF4149 domain-containing protein [Betaproteobacteria bacterium]NBP61979.1 DUF4149 domain-containing protein [Betaproteobacteria bacterium]NBQ08998.1 DUF4149 domain-containing protein [Betaproteobacteria bacterium]
MEDTLWFSWTFWQDALGLLSVALLFGGMTLFAFGFAALMFTALPPEAARSVIRRAFPPFYLWVIVTSACAAALIWRFDEFAAWLLIAITLSTVPARQILMPSINAASDTGNQRAFKWLHGLSVLITLAHIAACVAVLVRFVA